MIELLALDVDGTVLRHDGTIAPEDRDAVLRARANGIHVILCTGRILSGTRWVAESLGLDGELVCAGGSSTTDARTGAAIESHPLTGSELGALLQDLPGDVAPFLLSDENIHHDAGGEPFLSYVSTWSGAARAHTDLRGGAVGEPVLVTILMGPRDAIEAAAVSARDRSGGGLMSISFRSHRPNGLGAHVALVRRARTKGDALVSIARRRGLRRDQMAAVGDWLNDVPMFQAVGRSFVMGQADDEIARHATDRLESSDQTGGGIAEAVDRILEGRGCGPRGGAAIS